MTESAWFELVGKLGVGTVGTMFFAALIAGHRQVWVWGWQLREERKEKEFWRAQALGATRVAELAAAIKKEGT